MSVSTAFPLIVDRLIANLAAAATLTGIRVFDGAEIDESYPNDAIAIGHDASFGDSQIQAGSARNAPFAFGELHEETGTIACVLWAQDGISKFAPLRVRAFATLAKIDAVIRADTTLGGNSLYTYLESDSVLYRATPAGNGVVLTFTINYQSQT